MIQNKYLDIELKRHIEAEIGKAFRKGFAEGVAYQKAKVAKELQQKTETLKIIGGIEQ